MEALYAYVQSWGTEEEDSIRFLSWKGVDDYQEPLDPTSLSANFADVFPELASILNYRVERKLIINDVTQEKNKVLGGNINETVKFHSLDSSM